VRITSLLRLLVGITDLVVDTFSFELRDLVLEVRPRWRKPRCGGCGRIRPCYDRSHPRRGRHLGVGDLKIWLCYAPRRVSCRKCGIRAEQVPWVAPGRRFTRDFEEMAAYLARITDKTQVTRLLGISWRTVGRLVERVVGERLDADRLKGLRRIGIEEFSYRKRHRYLTDVVDHDRRRVVRAGPGKGAEALSAFFEALGQEGCGDEVRREQLRELRGTPEGTSLFGSRFAL